MRAFSASGVIPLCAVTLAELCGRQSGAPRDIRVGGFDLALRNLGDVALGELHLELVVDQLVEHFLPRRRLLRGKLDQPRALCDIDCRDRLAADNRDDLGVRGLRAPASISCRAIASTANAALGILIPVAKGIVSLSLPPRLFLSCTTSQSPRTARCPSSAGTGRIGALAEARPADRPQIDHQQHLVIGRRRAAVVIVGQVVERNGKAVVDVAKADAVWLN